MLEILKFIFSSFWIWLGTLFLVAIVCNCVADIAVHTLSSFTSRLKR